MAQLTMQEIEIWWTDDNWRQSFEIFFFLKDFLYIPQAFIL